MMILYCKWLWCYELSSLWPVVMVNNACPIDLYDAYFLLLDGLWLIVFISSLHFKKRILSSSLLLCIILITVHFFLLKNSWILLRMVGMRKTLIRQLSFFCSHLFVVQFLKACFTLFNVIVSQF